MRNYCHRVNIMHAKCSLIETRTLKGVLQITQLVWEKLDDSMGIGYMRIRSLDIQNGEHASRTSKQTLNGENKCQEDTGDRRSVSRDTPTSRESCYTRFSCWKLGM